jgi:uncharacterized protein (TIGR02996 family)
MNDLTRVFEKICEHPDDDELRFEYATLIQPLDPDRAEFIRIQMQRAFSYRRGELWGDEAREAQLLAAHRREWVGPLSMYAAHGDPYNIRFERGVPTAIEVNPRIFVEQADQLFRLAPLQHVTFIDPLDEYGNLERDETGVLAPFPMAEVLACPQLARLDRIFFLGKSVSSQSVQLLAQCPHLTRCLILDLRNAVLTEQDYLALAEGPLTRRLLRINPCPYGERKVEEWDPAGGYVWRTVFDEKWREVERRLGYIPWLHPSHHKLNDARWAVDHGLLPKYPVGSPPKAEWYDVPSRRTPRDV